METNKTNICPDCRFARMSGKIVIKCQRGFFIDLAYRYGKCKRFEPRIKPTTPSQNKESYNDVLPLFSD